MEGEDDRRSEVEEERGGDAREVVPEVVERVEEVERVR